MMKKVVFLMTAIGLTFIFMSCASTPESQSAQASKTAEVKKQTAADDYGKAGNTFLKYCRGEITAIANISADIKSSPKERTSVEVLHLYNILEIKQSDLWNKSGIYQMNHPEEGMRKAAMMCESAVTEQATGLSLDYELFSALAAISADDKSIADEDRYFLNDVLGDFKRNGVDKDEKTRDEIKRISAELTDLEQKYYGNIGGDRREIKITDINRLKGLPADFIAGHKPDKDGVITLTTDYPDYFPVMENAEDDTLRMEMYKNLHNVGYPQNSEIFSKLLIDRKKKAELLGYKNWAEYTQAKLMIGNPENAYNFIKKVADMSKVYANKDLEMILAKKKEMKGPDVEVEAWDRFFYPRIIQMEKYNFNPEDARKYFEISKVMNGLFMVAEKIFGVTFEKVKRDDVWDESVQSYNVLTNGKVTGMIDFDLYPRENKYKHFAMFTNELGVKGVRLPRAAIVGNFPQPVDGKAYVSHDDVQTLFHEFGHLMHSIFAGDQKYVRFSGTNCQNDFVEVPSQYMEEYVWEAPILQLWATNDEGTPIPADLVENMKKASEFAKGVHVNRQMHLSMLSLGIYLQDPVNFDHHAYEKKIEKEYSPWKSYDDTHLIENFGHLIGYSSNYYTYMWSLVIVKDIAGFIKSNGGLMNPAIMGKYRSTILNVGGAKTGNQMVEDFLGRDFTIEEFDKWMKQ